MGPVPERTPLGSKTVGVIQTDGYRIERVYFFEYPDKRGFSQPRRDAALDASLVAGHRRRADQAPVEPSDFRGDGESVTSPLEHKSPVFPFGTSTKWKSGDLVFALIFIGTRSVSEVLSCPASLFFVRSHSGHRKPLFPWGASSQWPQRRDRISVEADLASPAKEAP
jgi:hypothetical protein